MLMSSSQEATLKVLDLPADDPATILRLLCYLYTRQYDALDDVVPLTGVSDADDIDQEPAKGEESDRHKTAKAAYHNLRVYVAADKYGIPSLKSVAKDKFYHSLVRVDYELWPDILWELMNTVPQHGEFDDFIRPLVRMLAQNFPTATKVEGLRDILWEFVALTVALVHHQAKELGIKMERIKVLEANKRVLKQRIEDEKKHQQVLTEANDKCLRNANAKLKRLVKCEKCNAGFNAMIEARDGGQLIDVRCKLCDTWHGPVAQR